MAEITKKDIKNTRPDILFAKIDKYNNLHEIMHQYFLAMNLHMARLEERIIKLEQKLAA